MIHNFKFYIGDIESDIKEYDEDNYTDYEDLIQSMEVDRQEWTYNQIDSGYYKIN